uniref:Nucleotide-diphospho-sugar transferase domain-containing protein n=1 Tax=Alexandrium catenella TaxID=2925 RepID=A0A7S1RYM4_ALECA
MRTAILASDDGAVHCDADALWVRPPEPMLQHAVRQHPEADIVSQVSYGSHWNRAFKKWGFVLNTGFILFRKTPRVLGMVDSFMAVNQTKFEQGILNNYLLKLGCAWNQTQDNHTETMTVGRCGNLTVLLLPNWQVARVWRPHNNLTIFHPDLNRTKLSEIQSMGLC